MGLAERVFLTTIQGKFWRFDVKALVGSVLLGIVMNLIQQVTDRADAALTGGAFNILGAISFGTVAAISAIFFRFPGVLITTEVQAAIGLATANAPLSPVFPVANLVMSLVLAALVWKLSMVPWWHYAVLIFPAAIVGDAVVAAGIWLILQLPINIILISFVVATLTMGVGGSILIPLITRAIDRSGVLD